MASTSFQILFLATAVQKVVLSTLVHTDNTAADGLEDAVHSSSLMQSGRSTMMASVAQITEDPFEDLEDAFDSRKAQMHQLFGEEAAFKAVAPREGIDASFWFRLCLDLLIFGVVVCGVRTLYSKHAKTQKKTLMVARASAKAKVVSRRAPVDFGPLIRAASAGDETWRQILKEIPWVETKQDACGCTALHVAASYGSMAMAQKLLARGALVNAKEAWEETPLHMAARAGSVDVCKLLLAHGAELNAVDSSDRTALLAAAHAGKKATCDLLLEQGGDCGGRISDAELPPLLSGLLLSRMIKPLTVKACETVSDNVLENEFSSGSLGFETDSENKLDHALEN